MPFIEPDRRDRMLRGTLDDIQPGDRCFCHYKLMMDAWRKEPRWKTVDSIAAKFFPDDEMRAEFLAFLVFFNLHVIPYENIKRAENGDV